MFNCGAEYIMVNRLLPKIFKYNSIKTSDRKGLKTFRSSGRIQFGGCIKFENGFFYETYLNGTLLHFFNIELDPKNY